MSRYDAVLSYHLNPFTCGTAKFNHQLAEWLGVPCCSTGSRGFRYPLVSLKPDEMTGPPLIAAPAFDLLVHSDCPPTWDGLRQMARRVWEASTLGIPPTIRGTVSRGGYRVLTYGMAHKRVLHHYERLKAQLEREHPDYTIHLSTAIHEGHPWDLALQESEASLRQLFGDKFRFLGFLADDALAKELQECDAVAAYFTPALRANNTSAWAALQAGKTLYTNRDAHSPPVTAPMPTWERLIEALHGA